MPVPIISKIKTFPSNHTMTCGQSEAVARRYHTYVGKSGRTWLVADQPNAGDNVYVTNNPQNTTSSRQGFEGFGGATIKMPLVDGAVFELHGGWHSNPTALFRDTDIDVREGHLTQVWVARERTYSTGLGLALQDVLYEDVEPQLGQFDRGEVIARRLADTVGERVVLYQVSMGGSSCGYVYPTRVGSA